MIEFMILAVVVFLALIAVSTDNLRRSVIFLGVFSLAMAFAYLFYNAPDVALAEAAIGVGLSTIMYLVSLKKVRVYSILYVEEDAEEFTDKDINDVQPTIMRPLEYFLERTEEVEPQIAYTNRPLREVLDDEAHDFVIHRENDLTYMYGKRSDAIFQDIVVNLDEELPNVENVRVVFLDEVNDNVSNN